MKVNKVNFISAKNEKCIGRCYIALFLALLFLCFLFPYTGDDWAWGSSIGIERLINWFDNYSGRYVGNLIVLALTRSNMLKAFVMAICLTGIIFLVDRLSNQSKVGFYFIVVNLLFMPILLLRQAVVWTSGFANYTTSIFLTLIYVFYVKEIYEDERPFYSKVSIPFLFILGGVNTLIVEHLTLYNIFLSIYVIIVVYIKYKKIYIQHVSYSIGTIIGTLYMFSNSVYKSVATGKDSYRSIGGEEGIVTKIFNSYVDVISREGFLNNTILNIGLCIIGVLVWKKLKEQMSEKTKKIGNCCIVVIIAYAVTSVINEMSGVQQLKLLRIAEAGATLAFIFAWVVLVLIIPVTYNKRLKLLFILGSVGCMIAPLFVVTPIGSRCFFPSYIMQIYFALELYSLVGEKNKNRVSRCLKYFGLICGLSYLYLCYIYGMIFLCDQKRVAEAKNKVEAGEKVIQVENLPYEKYVWCSRPEKGSVWEERFKLFYGIDNEITIESKECHLR